MTHTSAPRPMAAFHDGQSWRLCHQPARTLTVPITDRDNLRTLPAEVNHWLAAGPDRLAVGLVGYEAAALLHHPDCTHTSTLPAAVVHLYTDTPAAGALPPAAPDDDFRLTSPFTPDWSRAGYLAALERIQAYLRAGDCYQVNLAQRFSSRFTGHPWDGWRALVAAHPAPHACYFEHDHGAVFGVSPERFLSVRGRAIVTEPIKGSQPRGRTPEEDQYLADLLRHSDKDRAENLMIVDLLRNDLGQLCEPGSIQAEPLFQLRRFSNVQHLVSTVRGTLRTGISPLEALLACFPGGSITGAPKRRAMQIIRELEPGPRGFYCGSLFWQRSNGEFDSSILIRTLQAQHGELVCHGGGGIVHDSDPAQEYAESLFKVEKLMAALER
ncbi:para-aminobenzoate synthase component I [Alcanivorax sp. S71-1-4]|uniref:anthranilate synthase component I family protein n=1 Tax=Alcanivorax sp. S71-1-4 TaxID=1177159 RepID=UPI0013582FBB|nr:anthranilate synthase component I family protein [Alcanivorax sp. S71-1-4]KAF0810564.1 para-aminobenzoate synthase component I [Alcanivorax sp. S71-1-4]